MMQQKLFDDSSIDLTKLTFDIKGVKFLGSEEKACARLLNKWLDLDIETGNTYQRSIDGKHSVDFYLPEQNIVLEWHPIILKWYMQDKNFKHLKHVLKGLPIDKTEQIKDIISDEIKHNYFQRRKFLLDRSHDPLLQKASLIVVENDAELFEKILKPYSKYPIKMNYVAEDFRQFKK